MRIVHLFPSNTIPFLALDPLDRSFSCVFSAAPASRVRLLAARKQRRSQMLNGVQIFPSFMGKCLRLAGGLRLDCTVRGERERERAESTVLGQYIAATEKKQELETRPSVKKDDQPAI